MEHQKILNLKQVIINLLQKRNIVNDESNKNYDAWTEINL